MQCKLNDNLLVSSRKVNACTSRAGASFVFHGDACSKALVQVLTDLQARAGVIRVH